MKKIFTLLSFLLLVAVQKMAACDCFPIATFCETITYENNGQVLPYLSVHRVSISALVANGVAVTVLETYAGDNLAGNDLTILDGNGADCVLFASTFLQVGGEYIIAAHGNGDTITVSECGVNFLPVANGMVSGAIAPGISEVALSAFANTANCGKLTAVGEEIPLSPPPFTVRPTLVSDEVEIIGQTDDYLANYLEIALFDSAGKLVFEAKYPGFGCFGFYYQAVVDMRPYSQGLYFLRLQIGQMVKTEKLVKMEQ